MDYDEPRQGLSLHIHRNEDIAMQKNNLQDIFLNRARKQAVPVTMFLMNGFQLRGIITGYDAFVVVLDTDGKQQVIYKHAISTIVPIRPVELSDDRGGGTALK